MPFSSTPCVLLDNTTYDVYEHLSLSFLVRQASEPLCLCVNICCDALLAVSHHARLSLRVLIADSRHMSCAADGSYAGSYAAFRGGAFASAATSLPAPYELPQALRVRTSASPCNWSSPIPVVRVLPSRLQI